MGYKKNDNLTFFWFVISNLIPFFGLYLFIKFKSKYPNKARLALVSSIIGSLIILVTIYLIFSLKQYFNTLHNLKR